MDLEHPLLKHRKKEFKNRLTSVLAAKESAQSQQEEVS
jgi:hypothetical protein